MPASPFSQVPGAKVGKKLAVPLNPGGLPSTDDVRTAVDASLQHKDWYLEVADRAAQIVGRENLPEFFTIFGITSAQTKVHDNIAATVQVMKSVRELMAQGKTWPEIRAAILDRGDQVQSVYKKTGQPRFDKDGAPVMEYTRRPTIPFVLGSGDKRQAIVNAYETGVSSVESGAKTSSYAGSFESAGQRVFDPRTTNDLWVWRGFNVRENALKNAANDDAAYRVVEAVLNEIAAEKGLPGHNVQASLWATMKNIREQAPDLARDYANGEKTLGQIVQEASQRRVDVNGRPTPLFEVPTGQASDFDRPEVQRVLAGSDPNLMRQPGPLKAGEMTRQYAGQGEIPRPSNLPFRLQERAVAEGRAPVATLPLTPEELDAAGLDRRDGVFPWLTVPHRVTESGGQAVIHLPGGTSETARYVGAILGERTGHPSVVSAPIASAPDFAGVRVNGTPEQIAALAADLHADGIPHVVGTTRGVMQIPHLGNDPSALLGTLQERARQNQIDPSGIALYTGEVTHATPAEHSGTVEAFQHTYRAPRRSDLPAGPAGGPGAEAGAVGQEARQAGQASPEVAPAPPSTTDIGSRPGVSRSAGLLGDVSNALGGGVFGAASGAAVPADTPEERRRNALLGAAAGMVGGPIAGRLLPRTEGALATFGASPHYKPPPPARVQAEAIRGAVRGASMNRAVVGPAATVPARVTAAVAATDDRAALRYAEDLLSDAAGSPRMRENDPARPSTRSRLNAGSVANERIQADLEPAVVDAARAGLQHELPQYVEDVHQKDILDEFYNRGYNESMAESQQRIASAQARGLPQNAIARLQARAQTQAEQAGLVKMRTRQGANPDMTYEALDARLQGQEQRLQANGTWQQLQDSAQAVWDHNAETLKRLVASGEVDPADAAYYAQAYPHYVPTVPISHLDARAAGPVAAAAGPRVSRGSQKVVHALEDVGTSGERLNPIVATRNATVRAERAIHRNDVASAFAQMMDDALQASPGTMAVNPATHRTFLGGGTDVTFMANGKPSTISVPKPVADGLEAASSMSADPGTVGRIWKQMMGTVTSSMTAGRASFLPVNLVRDAQDYLTRTSALEGGPQKLPGVLGTWLDEAGKAAADIARAQVTRRGGAGALAGAAAGAAVGDENTTPTDRARHAAEGALAGTFLLGANRVRPTGAAREFLARGGGSGGLSGYYKVGERWYRDVLRSGGAPIRSPQDAARYLGDWASDIASLQGIKGINERTELISRTAAMRRAEQARGLTGPEAVMAGRDASYDPDRAGTVARAINGIVPFFNASVQNAAQTVRLFRDNPVAATASIAATVGPAMLLAEAWNRSDPERAQIYDDVPQYLKDSGFVVVTPWAGSDARGDRPSYIWIPTGVQTPFVVGMRAAMQNLPGLEPTEGAVGSSASASSVEKWGDVLARTAQVFSPLRGESAAGALSSFVPQGVKQAIELGINRDLYRGNPIVTEAADERASAFSQTIASGANALGRGIGNDWLQEVRPSGVEHLVRALPAQSDIITGASDLVAPSGYKRAEDRPVANEPFVGGLASRFDRDTGGANLQRAQDEALPENVRSVFEQAGMRPSDMGTVPASYKGAPLTRDEQERWQQATNAMMSREVLAATRSQEWRARDADKQQLVRDAMARARQAAAERALRRLTDQEIERRMRTDAARKAG
jgi:hypothetical protein